MTPTTILRPRRSVLYMPGRQRAGPREGQDHPGRRPRSSTSRTRSPPTPRPRPAGRVCAAATSGALRPPGDHHPRPTASTRQWHADDLPAIAAAGPAAVVVPKINSAADVHAVEQALEAAGAPDHTAIWAMLETPIAMLHAEEIASCVRAADRARDGHQRPGQGAAGRARPRPPAAAGRAWRCACSPPARAGKVILDGVYNDIKDDAGFLAECVQGRAARLRRQDADPPQPGRAVQPRLRPERPRRSSKAGRIIAAFEEAEADGQGRRHRRRPHDREPAARRRRPPR